MRSARAVRRASAEAPRAPARSPAISSRSRQGSNAPTFPSHRDSSASNTAGDRRTEFQRSESRDGARRCRCPRVSKRSSNLDVSEGARDLGEPEIRDRSRSAIATRFTHWEGPAFSRFALSDAERALADDRPGADDREVRTRRKLSRWEAPMVAVALAREERLGILGGGREDDGRGHGFLLEASSSY